MVIQSSGVGFGPSNPPPPPTPNQENADSAKSRRARRLSAANSLLTACHISSLAEGQRSSRAGGWGNHSSGFNRGGKGRDEWEGGCGGGLWLGVCGGRRGREVGETPAACRGWKSSLILLSPGGEAGGRGCKRGLGGMSGPSVGFYIYPWSPEAAALHC